jgi:hypothetical protein
VVRTAGQGTSVGGAGDPPPTRGLPGWADQLAYTIVLLGMGGGLAWVALHHFKRGAALIAGTLILGGLLRAVLPARVAGLLASRSRVLDTVVMCLLGIGIGVVAYFVPRPS